MTAVQWDTLAEEFGPEVYSEALYQLTRLEVQPAEARERLQAIVAHQRQLSKDLNRCVSLITAICDYFTQVDPMVREPVLVEVRLLQQKEEFAVRDELTGLLNRRSFNQEVPREMERFRRFGQCFSLLLLDLDRFKDFNDANGHSAGDQALQDVGRILTETARLYDRVIRYGGEEFAVILPQTNGDEAQAVAERIRLAVARHHVRFAGQDLAPVTVSTGLACYPKDGLDMEGLVHNADKALYEAKALRNTVLRFRDSKRSHPRYLLSDPLPLTLRTEEQDEIRAEACDVSFGGLRCISEAPFQPATPLHVVLTDAARALQLPLRAEVRHLAPDKAGNFQLGLSFHLGVEEQIKLLALLDGRMALASTTLCGIVQPRPADC
ncbi:MAG: diguanylate cyclase [Humidesulfovibrio sp.]|nr:diguanylate cyclase [Humidesulfovibrio sp.]